MLSPTERYALEFMVASVANSTSPVLVKVREDLKALLQSPEKAPSVPESSQNDQEPVLGI